MKAPHWTILMVTLGAFALPLIGGHISIEAGTLSSSENALAAILGGDVAPFLSHYLISLLFFIPFTATLFTRRISQVVNVRISIWLAIFAACVGASIVVSSFPATTVVSILDWVMMSLAFFAVTICCGRRQSNWPIMGFIAGVTLAAISGIQEYNGVRAFDPGYRIFALQVNPNQAGALFAATSVLSLAMAMRLDRVPRLAMILASIMMSFAMVLTQSKGAILCLPLGVLVVFVGSLAVKAAKPGALIATFILPLAVTGVLAVGAQKAASSQSGSSAISRIANTGGEAAQSAGFRKLLWMSAIDLTKQHPYGWGMGSYWYESTRSGRVTQTTLAHQTFLQLASEASPLAPLALLGFIGSVVIWGLRGIRSLPDETKIFLVGLLGTLCVSLAHNFVDSDMYVFSLGSFVFLVCGAFTATSVDSQAPEFIFTLPKIAYSLTALLLIPLSLSFGIAELHRAEARGAMREMNRQGIIDAASAAISASFADGQAYALRGQASGSEDDLVAAAKFHPSPKSYRALADFYLKSKKYQEAFRALDRALERDPMNASALQKYVEAADQAGNVDLAIVKARALVGTETATYFTVRSQPEFIPIQTYWARLFLAKQTKDNAAKAELLAEAIKGYAQYRDITVPVVMRTLKIDPRATIAGEDKPKILGNMTAAIAACKELVELQRLGVATPAGVDPAKELAAFTEVFESTNK